MRQPVSGRRPIRSAGDLAADPGAGETKTARYDQDTENDEADSNCFNHSVLHLWSVQQNKYR